MESERTLTPREARRYYDRFGAKQDSQGFYEDPALAILAAQADFEHAGRVFEFGCGTGKFAARLLSERLPPDARYHGCDISPVMVALATQRLRPYAERAQVTQTDGGMNFPIADASCDRVVCNYVLDLLSVDDSRALFAEARRVLVPGGMLCLVSLTTGITPLSRALTFAWGCVFRLRPSLVGGCRPVQLHMYAGQEHWRQEYCDAVVAFGIPSEVLLLRRIDE